MQMMTYSDIKTNIIGFKTQLEVYELTLKIEEHHTETENPSVWCFLESKNISGHIAVWVHGSYEIAVLEKVNGDQLIMDSDNLNNLEDLDLKLTRVIKLFETPYLAQ